MNVREGDTQVADSTEAIAQSHNLIQPQQVAFDYIKSNFFRVVHADGVTGGGTPNGSIHLAFFSERGPIPQREVRSINADGTFQPSALSVRQRQPNPADRRR